MSNHDIRLTIVGTGVAAEFHRDALLQLDDPDVTLAAVVHHDRSRYSDLSARFGAPCISFETLTADPSIDAVILCTPSGLHAAETIQLAEAGKHVLVEKPMATSTPDADRMIEACLRNNVKLGVVFQRRLVQPFRTIREAVLTGAIGQPLAGLITLPYYRGQDYYDSAEWRGTWSLDGGGILMNQGSHLVDLLNWCLGDPVEVFSLASTGHHHIEVEDVAGAVLHLSSGALATIMATSAAAPGFPHRFELFGTDGCVQVEGEQVIRWVTDHARYTTFSFSRDEKIHPPTGAGSNPRDISLSGHTAVLSDFIDAIRTDRDPAVNGYEGRRSLATIETIYKASGINMK